MKDVWARPTLADGAIGIACLAVGMAAPRYLESSNSPGVMVRLLDGIIFGGSLAGPLILGLQVFRGRRAAFSAGEYFWISPIALHVLMLAINSLKPTLALGLLWVFVQGVLSLFAWAALVMSFRGLRPSIPCRWSDGLGCLICGLAGPFLIYVINDALNEL